MSNLIEIIVLVAVILMRLWSRNEHKRNHKDIAEIKIFINGKMQEELEKAKEQGRIEERNKNIKNKL